MLTCHVLSQHKTEKGSCSHTGGMGAQHSDCPCHLLSSPQALVTVRLGSGLLPITKVNERVTHLPGEKPLYTQLLTAPFIDTLLWGNSVPGELQVTSCPESEHTGGTSS